MCRLLLLLLFLNCLLRMDIMFMIMSSKSAGHTESKKVNVFITSVRSDLSYDKFAN